MLDTKSKAIQRIKIEHIALSNTIRFESNTFTHYIFAKAAIIQYCLGYAMAMHNPKLWLLDKK